MNLTFVHPGDASMASFRYRTLMPAQQLTQSSKFDQVCINEGMADVVVFSKPLPQQMDFAKQCKKDGTRVIVDICDGHFDHDVLGPVYREMISLSDEVVCPTDSLRDRIHDISGRDSVVIPDPYEHERCEPHAEGNEVLWYGHQSNLADIIPYVQKLDNLSVCTGPNNLLTGYIPWTIEAQREELARANIVILPGRNEEKSANRLINAVMAGCFVCADPTAARKEFRQYLWTNDVFNGLRWAKVNRYDLNELVSECQDYIEVNYSPEQVGKLWASVV